MSVRLIEGRSAGTGLPLKLSDLRKASFDDLRQAGLDRLLESGLAKQLATVDNQHLIVWSGTGVVSPIEVLVGIFPSQGVEPYITLDDFSDGGLWALHTALVSLVDQIGKYEVQSLGKATPSDVIITQHIGGEESDYGDIHLQSFKQFHLHVFTDSSQSRDLPVYSKSLRNGLREPFARLMSDVVESGRMGAKLTFDIDQGALVIADHAPRFSMYHLEMLANFMAQWRQAWDGFASHFTNFETDQFNRFTPRISEESWDALRKKYDLSPQSTKLLSFLERQLQPASQEGAPWSWLSKGVYGSLCIQHHGEQNTWSVKVFPRTRVTDFRTLTMEGGQIKVFEKNRSLSFPPEEEFAYIHNQMETQTMMAELFKLAVPFVVVTAIFQWPALYRRKYPGRNQVVNMSPGN